MKKDSVYYRLKFMESTPWISGYYGNKCPGVRELMAIYKKPALLNGDIAVVVEARSCDPHALYVRHLKSGICTTIGKSWLIELSPLEQLAAMYEGGLE